MVTEKMFLFAKWCFVVVFVVDAKRLSISHTSLTVEDGEAFVKKTAPGARVCSCHLFVYFCHLTLQKSNLVASLVEFGWGRRSEGQLISWVARDAQHSTVLGSSFGKAVLWVVVLAWRKKKSLRGGLHRITE